MSAITITLNRGPVVGWSSPLVMSALAVAVLAAIAFGAVNGASPRPFLDMSLLRNRTFALSSASLFLAGLSMASVNFVLPFFLQLALGLNPARMGLLLAAPPTLQMLLSPVSGRLTDRIGFVLPATLGVAMDVLAALWLSTASITTAGVWMVLRLALVGVGPGLLQTPNQMAVMTSAPPERAGMASGFLGTMRHLGMITGVASVGTFFSLRSSYHAAVTGGNAALGFAAGFREAMWMLVAVNLVGVIVSASRARRRTPTRD